MRTLLIALLFGAAALPAQAPTAADSALVLRLLTAEDRRDTSSTVWAEGRAHADPRIQMIARRGLARSRDAKFAARDSMPALPAPPVYTEPAWRLRFRALATAKDDCGALKAGLSDSVWAVRMRAADLLTVACGKDAAIVRTLTGWIDGHSRMSRSRNGAAWQPAGHAITALARIAPSALKPKMEMLVNVQNPWVSVYVARAATTLSNDGALRWLAMHSKNGNVREAAIEGLAKVKGHQFDNLFSEALEAKEYQVVRAGAIALKQGTSGSDIRRAAIAAAYRLRKDSSETSRDARTAVYDRLEEFAEVADAPAIAGLATDFDCQLATRAAALATKLGKTTTASCTSIARPVPAEAVRLALGDSVSLKVTMTAASGGGSFVVRLRGDNAPIMAARVLAMAKAGYYKNLTFHRVEPDFVVQGLGRDNEYVGYPRFFRDELGGVSHARGTVGMSTRGHDTGDAQWFVNLKDNRRLDRDYSVFAEVTSGIDIVDGILEGDRVASIVVVGGR